MISSFRERAVGMMKVLAWDWDGMGYWFGRYLSADENPLRWARGGLEFNVERGLVSLIVVDDLDDEE